MYSLSNTETTGMLEFITSEKEIARSALDKESPKEKTFEARHSELPCQAQRKV